jgi:hypothetical protein
MEDKSILVVGPADHPWHCALEMTAPDNWRVIRLASRRSYVRDARRYRADAVVLGEIDADGIPNAPLLAQQLEHAPRCTLVCVHDAARIALPSSWCPNAERITHVLRAGRSHLDASLDVWRLVTRADARAEP